MLGTTVHWRGHLFYVLEKETVRAIVTIIISVCNTGLGHQDRQTLEQKASGLINCMTLYMGRINCQPSTFRGKIM